MLFVARAFILKIVGNAQAVAALSFEIGLRNDKEGSNSLGIYRLFLVKGLRVKKLAPLMPWSLETVMRPSNCLNEVNTIIRIFCISKLKFR
jgi:hypothetical protein